MPVSVFNPKYASILNRFKATLIDFGSVALVTFIVVEFGGGWHRHLPIISDFFDKIFYTPEPALQSFVFILFFLAYDASLSSSPLRGSLGKHFSKIKITNLDHLQITVFKAFFRTLLKLLCLAPCIYTVIEQPQTLNTAVYLIVIWYLFLGLFWLYSPKFQFPHDFLAKTIVVPN